MSSHPGLTGEALAEAAKELENKVNEEIELGMKHWVGIEVNARADAIIQRLVGPEWDWHIMHTVSGAPSFFITGYDYRKVEEI